jgi:hypothetical protein
MSVNRAPTQAMRWTVKLAPPEKYESAIHRQAPHGQVVLLILRFEPVHHPQFGRRSKNGNHDQIFAGFGQREKD